MPGVEEALHARIEAERAEDCGDVNKVQLYRDYVAGKQPLTLTDEQREVLSGLLKNDFCDNVCRRIVSTVAARVRVDRMEVADTGVATFLQEMWTLNWFRQLSNRVHFTAIRDGDTYASLSWDNKAKRVTVKRELKWNGKRGVYMHFTDMGVADYAFKEWETKVKDNEGNLIPAKRRVVWEDNRIGRFILKNDGWEWFTLPMELSPDGTRIVREAEKPGWQPWTDNNQPNGKPLGIPCVQFSRMEQPEDGHGQSEQAADNYGVSILAGGVIGVQDAINDDHWSILAANRMSAYQVVTVSGVSLVDGQGREVKLRMLPGAVIHVEDKDAKFGTIPAGDMSQLLSALKEHHNTAARSTNCPIHTITGDWPSGEALIQADRPLVDQATALADSFGPSWASVMHKATTIANTFGQRGLNSASLITTIFQPAERADLITLSAIAAAIAPYVSQREVLRVLRYPPEKIEQIMRERKAEASFLEGGSNEEPTGDNPAAEGGGGGNEEG